MEKVKRYGIFDGSQLVKICLTEEEAKDLTEKWNTPIGFTFPDERDDFHYEEIWV